MGLLPPPSFSPFLSMFFVLLLLVGSVPDSVHYGNETDRLALLAFKAEITGDPLGILSSWNGSVHFCQWVGVTCGRRHQRVTSLILINAKIMGSISPHIGNLSFLMRLSLENNSMSHNIPQQIGNLRRLKFMSMYNNLVTGEIPANLSRCSNLVVLRFSKNRLTGKIPTELGRLSKLRFLSVGRNNLTGGMPPTIGNLSSLTTLVIPFNSIGGNIPDGLGQLTSLEIFALEDNRFVGTIPSSLFNISSITGFDIGINQIQGILPSNLGTSFPNLEFLGVSKNLLTGSIPSSISNATNLYYLGLGKNNLSGKMPSLDKLRNLEWLTVGSNHLGTGEADDLSFLSSLINATKLHVLALNNNGFGGVFPEAITNFSIRLSLLYLGDNNLYGSIPRGIKNLVNLQTLRTENNHLTEYGMGNEVSTSGDMYSFGILLLEMFTGKRPTDAMFEGSLTLHNFVEMAMVEQVANIVDPTLFQQVVMREASSSINSSQNQSPASIHEVQECLTSILKVGIACSEELPRDRPDIKEIVTQLHVIKNSLLGVGVHGGMRASIAT